MKKILPLVLFIVTFCLSAHSQKNDVDSLEDALTQRTTTKIKIDIYNQINSRLLETDSLNIDYIKKSIALSEKIGYKEGLGKAYFFLGQSLYFNSRYDSALSLATASLEIHKALDDEAQMATDYSFLGAIHEHQGNYGTAVSYYFKSLEMREEMDDQEGIAHCYSNIAIVHNYQENYNKSVEYFTKSLSIYKQIGNENEIANILNNIGVIYRALGDYAKAREYYNQSLETKLKINDKIGVSNTYNNIGITYFYEGNYDKALEYYQKGLNIREASQNKNTLASSHINIGEVYIKLSRYLEAEETLQKALQFGKLSGNKDDLMITYQLFAELNKAQGNFEKALTYLETHNMIRDSIYSESQARLLAEMETKYEVDKKEKEIALLKKENEIISIKEENAEIIRNTFIIATIIISILIFAITRSYWQEMANSKLLKNQKAEIEAQNEKLTDLSQEKDQLMRIVAHDLRSPLNQIEGLIKLISFDKDRLSDQQVESLERMKHSVVHSKELLSKILSTRALDSAELKLKLEKVNLKHLVNMVVKEYETTAHKKNIQLNLETSDIDNLEVMADKDYTEQVIDNLLSNAIKFSPLEEKVDIALKGSNGKVTLEVKDNGPGISKDDLGKLFGKYQKLSAQPTAGETSTGLGLSIVKKYVDVMNGKVWYENNNGKGAKFIVELNKA